jgi:hypothetical protein
MRSHPYHYVEVNDEPCASAALYLATEHSKCVAQEAGCVERVSAAWRLEKEPPPYRELSSDSPRRLVSILTEAVPVPCLYIYTQNHRITVYVCMHVAHSSVSSKL